jgi:Gas vesicle protein
MNMRAELQAANGRASGLVDVLDRVLDKGLVVAGDVRISLAEVELLTIRIRLIVCSIDKAEQIGLDWWRYDANLAPGRDRLAAENAALKRQIRSLERRVAALAGRTRGPARRNEEGTTTRSPGRSSNAR